MREAKMARMYETASGRKKEPARPSKKKMGRKTGEGYYTYETRVTSDEAIKDEYDHTILLKAMVEEAEKVVENGIADKTSVDTAMKLGANIPKGPFEIKEELHDN